MRITDNLLPHRIKVENVTGEGAHGKTYSAHPVYARARVRLQHRVTLKPEGDAGANFASMAVKPDLDITLGAKVTWIDEDVTYTVTKVIPGVGVAGIITHKVVEMQ